MGMSLWGGLPAAQDWLQKAMGLCRSPGHSRDSQLLAGRPSLLQMLVCWASGMACRTGLLEVSSI